MSLNPAAAIVARKLKQQGYTNAQIAGVLGNMYQESGFNPRVNEGGIVGKPLGRGGYGLPQWTGDRQTNLINFAKTKKLDPGDAGLQADFLLYELQGPEKRAAESLRKAQSPEQAALVFRRDFERAGIPKDENRMRAARDLLPKLQTLGDNAAVAQSAGASGLDAKQFLEGFILKNLLVNQTLNEPTVQQQILKSLFQRPATALEFDINTASLYTPRSSFLESLTQF